MVYRMDFGGQRRAEPRLDGGSYEKEGDQTARKAWKERGRGRWNLKMGYILPFSVG